MRSWVGGGEGVVLAKAVKIVTFGIHYSQKNPYTGAKHERERSGESEVNSESTGCFLLGGSKQWLKISGKLSSFELSCNNFHTLCRKFKIMRVFKQLLEDPERWPSTGRGYRELDTEASTSNLSACWSKPRILQKSIIISQVSTTCYGQYPVNY